MVKLFEISYENAIKEYTNRIIEIRNFGAPIIAKVNNVFNCVVKKILLIIDDGFVALSMIDDYDKTTNRLIPRGNTLTIKKGDNSILINIEKTK